MRLYKEYFFFFFGEKAKPCDFINMQKLKGLHQCELKKKCLTEQIPSTLKADKISLLS